MLEKDVKGKKLVKILIMCMMLSAINASLAYGKTITSSAWGIAYKFVGNVVQSGVNLKATGSTYAKIDTSKKTNYVEIFVDKDYTNKAGVSCVKTVKKYNNKAQRTVTIPGSVMVNKAENGKLLRQELVIAFLVMVRLVMHIQSIKSLVF